MAPFKTVSSALIGHFVSELDVTETRRGAVATSPNPNTPGNGYIYHIFTAPGTFTVTTSGYIDLLLVGGGAGGGKGSPSSVRGGGGGAGGFREEYNIFCPAQSYTITIGSGGNGTSSYGGNGSPGGTSYFTSPPAGFKLINNTTSTSLSVGGGGGGSGAGSGLGSPQGSGGGGEGNGGGPGPSGTYGSPGGRGNVSPYYAAGAGGGAYELGANAPGGNYGGAGGDGRVAFAGDTGIPTGYGGPAPSEQFGGSGRCFAGGGGGAGRSGAGAGGAGGAGGGNGGNATTNTGSGGGGSSPPGSAGNGAPGIVIIRVKVNPT